MKMPRRITLGLASAAAALMLVAAPLPAQAAAPKIDLTKIYVKSLVVGDDECRDLTIVPKFKKAAGMRDESADLNFIYKDQIWASPSVSPGINYKEWCPSDGFGKHRVVAEEVEGYFGPLGSGDSYSRTDNTKTVFYIRAKAKAGLSAKRTSKKTVKLSASAKYLKVEQSWFSSDAVYKPYAAKKVAFQVKSGSKWKTFKTVNLGKKGTASVTVKRTVKANYRVVVPKTDSKAGVTTATVKK